MKYQCNKCWEKTYIAPEGRCKCGGRILRIKDDTGNFRNGKEIKHIPPLKDYQPLSRETRKFKDTELGT